jgi:hypothetical protein
MPQAKRLLCPARVREVPRQFSWLDQRLVRDRYIERCQAPAWALYLFLVIVADHQGISYYANTTIAKRLSLSSETLYAARSALIREGLIAYDPPLYQVLALPTGESGPIVEALSAEDIRHCLNSMKQTLKAHR